MLASIRTSPRARWYALAALGIAMLTFGLDTTVLNVALPDLAVDLHASTGQLQWFANAYTLVLAAALLPAGMLGDRFGPKRYLIGGVAVFGVGSLLCAYSNSAGMLIGSRALLGVGAALMVPLASSVLTRIFPPAERGRAIAVWATAMSLGIPLGPVVGGWLLEHFWWGSVFLINIPLVAIGVVALTVFLPALPGTGNARVDSTGIAASSVGLLALTYGIVQAGQHGWGSAEALPIVVVGLAVLAGFCWSQRGVRAARRDTLVDLSLFRSAGFTWGSALATLATFVLMGAMFVLPQYFSAVGGQSALGTGLRLLPTIGGLMVGVQIADRARPRLGAKVVVTTGFAFMALATAIGATGDADTGYAMIAAWTAVLGLGLGFALPPAMDIALGALRPAKSGVGSAVTQALRQVGATFGVAILGAVLNAGYRGGLPGGIAPGARESVEAGARVAHAQGSPSLLASVQHAFADGMGTTLWWCTAVGLLAAALAWAFLPTRPEDVAPEPEREPATIGA